MTVTAWVKDNTRWVVVGALLLVALVAALGGVFGVNVAMALVTVVAAAVTLAAAWLTVEGAAAIERAAVDAAHLRRAERLKRVERDLADLLFDVVETEDGQQYVNYPKGPVAYWRSRVRDEVRRAANDEVEECVDVLAKVLDPGRWEQYKDEEIQRVNSLGLQALARVRDDLADEQQG